MLSTSGGWRQDRGKAREWATAGRGPGYACELARDLPPTRVDPPSVPDAPPARTAVIAALRWRPASAQPFGRPPARWPRWAAARRHPGCVALSIGARSSATRRPARGTGEASAPAPHRAAHRRCRCPDRADPAGCCRARPDLGPLADPQPPRRACLELGYSARGRGCSAPARCAGTVGPRCCWCCRAGPVRSSRSPWWSSRVVSDGSHRAVGHDDRSLVRNLALQAAREHPGLRLMFGSAPCNGAERLAYPGSLHL